MRRCGLSNPAMYRALPRAVGAATTQNADVHFLPVRGEHLHAGRAPAATSRFQRARMACCWWIPACAQMSDQVLAAIRQIQKQNATNGVANLHWGAEGDPPCAPSWTPMRRRSRSATSSTRTCMPITSAETKRSAKRAEHIPAEMSRATSRDAGEGAAIIAHENVLNRLSADASRPAALRHAAHRHVPHREHEPEPFL